MEKASGVNLEEKSGVGVPKAVRRCLQLPSGSYCGGAGAKLSWPYCSFGSTSDVERGDVLHGQLSVLHITTPRLTSTVTHLHSHIHNLRGHSSFAVGVDTTRGARDTGYKLILIWRRAWRQGLLPMVGGIFAFHWTATARLKLGVVPPQSVFLIGNMGIGHNPTSRPLPLHQATKGMQHLR